ncbi:FAD-dependent oxidoreductase [Thalassotalea sp. PP2-459]|uniref:FAD-dependent oxidoreductase n=1 Tax=Thalassotalea sp. PP2-459 TaxID=1742724 RepID=UPI0009423433|nr:FAD-dependent oxidoreductase [Thalassotalea sp. PP2-459]OKY26695.1 FAD-dependent oxidoreductase [Thalassotalea sp. PP2-459]
MSNQHQAFWFNDALTSCEIPNIPILQGKITADVCIIGGGYTGLWTAIKIKQQDPTLQVVIVEKGVCGQGASGRNGGCMLTFSTKFASLIQLFGINEAKRLVQASEQAVLDIANFCKQHHINADIRTDGAIYTATNSAQQSIVTQPLPLLKAHNINQWQQKTKDYLSQVTGSKHAISGIESPAAGSLHPGKLVLGLVKHALSMGIFIYQQSPYLSHKATEQNIQVKTPQGEIISEKLVFAVNAWMGQLFNDFNRYYTLVSSDMVITKPMPKLLANVGLDHGKAIADSRIFVHYYRSTPDGRLMLGKGGNLFAFNNRMLPAFDQPSRYQQQLTNAFKQFFPRLPCDFTTSWTGASDRSTTGLPFFGTLAGQKNVYYGLGYSGNGVVQSYLGGDILSSMVLGIDNEWTRSPMAKGPISKFPPEPIRYLGAQLVKRSIMRKEQAEALEQQPTWFDIQLAKFAAAAGKADK